jgi:hypothetical protein
MQQRRKYLVSLTGCQFRQLFISNAIIIQPAFLIKLTSSQPYLYNNSHEIPF